MEDINAIALALSMARNVVPGDWNRIDATPRDIWRWLQTSAGLAELGEQLAHDVGPVDWASFETQMMRASACGARVVSRWDEAYPAGLRPIGSPPPVVFVRGDVTLLSRRTLGMVGTRAPSAAGVALATRLARDVAAHGVCVASGLARGIDTAAHRGALDVDGATVAVLGTGVDVAYPAENAGLMARIIERGCIVSEQWCGTQAVPHAFPRRNRIISGISEAVVVVEGGIKSGALITARWALEQGRDVGAVPGFPGDFRSAGPNQLLRSGAFLVEGASDVFTHVARLGVQRFAVAAPGVTAPAEALDADARRIYDLVAHDAGPDDVARSSGIDVGRVQEILGRLEIEGWVVRSGSGRFAQTRR